MFKIYCSCGKGCIRGNHKQFLERFIEHRKSIEKTLQPSKPPKTLVLALVQHTFFHSEHFVQFDEATANPYEGV